MASVRVGDVGTQINVITKTDLTHAVAATLRVKVIRWEDRWTIFETHMEWPAIIKGLPKDGVLEHIARSGDFDEAGEYSIAAYVTFDDGRQFTGEAAKLTVNPVFD